MRRTRMMLLLAAALTALIAPSTASAAGPHHSDHAPSIRVLTSGLDGALGSTVGPDGAFYVAEGIAGRISRIDPRTGRRTTFVSGLADTRERRSAVRWTSRSCTARPTSSSRWSAPTSAGPAVDGIYRVDGPHHVHVVADIGAYSLAHPPVPAFFIPTGVQFALHALPRRVPR